MIDKRFIEKRKYPRIAKSIPLKIADTSFKVITETINLSQSGAFCKINKYLPPLTKLNITLLIPPLTKGSNKNHPIECKGVVVRAEPIENTQSNDQFYNTAIFFNHLENKDAQLITQYINWYLKGEKN